MTTRASWAPRRPPLPLPPRVKGVIAGLPPASAKRLRGILNNAPTLAVQPAKPAAPTPPPPTVTEAPVQAPATLPARRTKAASLMERLTTPAKLPRRRLQPPANAAAATLPLPVLDAAGGSASAPDDEVIEAPPPPPVIVVTRVAGSAIAEAGESRLAALRGQVRQDCAALANMARAIGRRIEAGEVPRQEGEFLLLARKLDQDCASLYEVYRLLRCYK